MSQRNLHQTNLVVVAVKRDWFLEMAAVLHNVSTLKAVYMTL